MKKYSNNTKNNRLISDSEALKQLSSLGKGWSIIQPGRLVNSYKFEDFRQAMEIANKIAILAEEENHHPSIKIEWGLCKIEIWTHTLGGLTQKDFSLAKRITELL